MNFYTINNLQVNSDILLTLNKEVEADGIRVSSSSYYTVFCDGRVVSFGPNRTAKGYVRIKKTRLKNFKELKIVATYIGKPIAFDIEYQQFFIGIELLSGDKVVASAIDFDVCLSTQKLSNACRFSPQRAFIERYDYTILSKVKLVLEKMENEPTVLSINDDNCDYNTIKFTKLSGGDFTGFYSVAQRKYLSLKQFASNGDFDLDKGFFDVVKSGYKFTSFRLNNNSTGLISINFLNVKSNQKVFIVFNEMLVNGKWEFGRSNCNEVIEIKLSKGDNYFTSTVPYTMGHLMVLSKDNIDVQPQLVLIQNDRVLPCKDYNDEKINAVMNAARNTFMQNAFDIFTDCPSRERAGWLCDSYFLGIAEKFFTGTNAIERNFLENFAYSNCKDIPDKMLPMCYPADHTDKTFLPNWAMWFVVELERYFDDCKDLELVVKLKDKVYNLVDFFKGYENSYGLLENLPSWVFIEWSEASGDEYIKCVSFCTNMLYYGMLRSIAKLYDDIGVLNKANKLKDTINKFSYDGSYYCDNGIYVDNKFTPQRNHTSETCQYFALFFGLTNDDKLKDKMINNFYLLQSEGEQDIAKSAVFIGNFLRVLWLLREKHYQKVLDETVDYFYLMAKETGTLWEKFTPTASCCHGFASCIAYVIDKCIIELKK